MNGKLAAFWHKTGETALLVLAFVWPLASYLQTYDGGAIKTATFELGVLVMAAAWFLKSVERGRFELPARAVWLLAPAAALLGEAVFRFTGLEHKAAALPAFLDRVLCIVAYGVCVLEFGGQDVLVRSRAWLLRAAWIAGLYGLCQRYGLDPLPWKGAFDGRVFSTLAAPEEFASFIAICLPLCAVGLLDRERGFLAKAADIALSALLCANLLWTDAVPARSLAPLWLLWPLAGMLAGFSLLARPGGAIFVLPLPWGEGRRWLYAPALAALAGLAVFPVRWTRSGVEHNLAIHYSKQRDWKEALAHYDRVAPGSPDYVSARYLAGIVYLRLGKPEEALREFAVVQALAPDHRRLEYEKGVAYAQVFDWEKALASHEAEALRHPLDAANLRALAQAATVRGELERAAQAARRAIALEPGQAANWQALSAVYLKEKKTVAARRVLGEGRRLGLKFDKPGSNR